MGILQLDQGNQAQELTGHIRPGEGCGSLTWNPRLPVSLWQGPPTDQSPDTQCGPANRIPIIPLVHLHPHRPLSHHLPSALPTSGPPSSHLLFTSAMSSPLQLWFQPWLRSGWFYSGRFFCRWHINTGSVYISTTLLQKTLMLPLEPLKSFVRILWPAYVYKYNISLKNL